MNSDFRPGKYVVAVSGGVDSMVLLHMLVQQPNLELIIAHFDHGIRSDAYKDRELVQQTVTAYGVQFRYAEGKLGVAVSEARAREARYEFLRSVHAETGALAIVTAHHQDDVLETAMLNILRGTGRRGLSSLKSSDSLRRPLLNYSKEQLISYARLHKLVWREDSTNADTKYLRNYIRMYIVPRLSVLKRQELLTIIKKASELNELIDGELSTYLAGQRTPEMLDRTTFTLLPHIVAREVMAAWLLKQTRVQLSRQLLERLVVAAKTGRIGSKVDIDAYHWLQISPTDLALVLRER